MNLLEFANPLGWWWAAIALPIVAFYSLKVRLRRLPVSTMLFWDRVYDEKKPRAWWQRLRHWLSLFLQLALLMLLVAALVDPLWSWQKNQRRKLVLIVDNSASMGADDAGVTRFTQAKSSAASLVRSLRVGDEMAVLTAGGRAAVAIGWTGHARSLLEAVDRIELTDAPNSLSSAVTMAQRLVPASEPSKIILLSDGCDRAIDALKSDKSITLYGFGKAQDNLAITQFQVRRSLLDAIGYQVLVEISNLGDQSKKCRLELNLEDVLVDVVPLELEPGASKTLNLDHASATGGRLVATIDAEDALAVDNRALAVLPTRRKMPITLATPGSVFLKSVLQSIPLVDLSIVESAPANWQPNRDSILVLHQKVPQQLPAGKLLIINPRNNCNLWTVGERIETPLVSTVDESSPVTQHVRLTNVLFPDARTLNFIGEANSIGENPLNNKALIKTPLDEPLLSYIRRPIGDVLILNVDLDLGDLPLRIAFPVLMKNAVEWFQGSQGELQPALATGQPASIKLPRSPTLLIETMDDTKATGATKSAAVLSIDNAETVEVIKTSQKSAKMEEFLLQSPSGERTPLARDETQANLAVLNRCGLWTVGTEDALDLDPWKPEPRNLSSQRKRETKTQLKQTIESSPTAIAEDNSRFVRLACNLCSREESDLRPRVKLKQPTDFGMLSLGGRSIWFYLVLAGLLLATCEWWLYQRRVVG